MSTAQHTPERKFVAADGQLSTRCATCGGWIKYHGLATGSCDTKANITYLAERAKATGSAKP